jgi:hypothetical protein
MTGPKVGVLELKVARIEAQTWNPHQRMSFSLPIRVAKSKRQKIP